MSPFPVCVTISVAIEDVPIDTSSVVLLVERLLQNKTNRGATVHLVIAGHRLVRQLNRDYLQHDSETDVLSFDLSETDDALEGEVYIDAETARERCYEFGASFQDEVARYAIHGVLHLLGMDDATEAQREEMRHVENEYLQTGRGDAN